MAETIKMKALRRFHYPSGPTGRDYHEGDDVEVLNERDAKALRLIRVAKDAETPSPKQEAETPSVPRRAPRTYRRSDMEAEQTQTKPMTTETASPVVPKSGD